MKRILATAAAALAIVAAVPARAGTASSSLAVTATVAKNCVITAGSLNFGAYDPVGANASSPKDMTGTFTVACTKNTAYTVTLDAGLPANAGKGTYGTRAMKSAITGAYLGYEIFTDNTYGTVWNAANTVGSLGATSVSAVTLTAYGRIGAAQDVPAAADYSDTVTSTVNF